MWTHRLLLILLIRSQSTEFQILRPAVARFEGAMDFITANIITINIIIAANTVRLLPGGGDAGRPRWANKGAFGN